MGWNDFSLPAVGEWFDNDDGTSRQAELARCERGEQVQLVREPENPHDRMAVAVFSCRGIRVGYLKRDRAVWIGSKIDRGYDVRAIVERVKGAHLPDATLGLVMRVSMDPDVADEPELLRDWHATSRKLVAVNEGAHYRDGHGEARSDHHPV